MMDTTIRHLYAHIPFCPSKCSYCAFVTHIGSLKLLPAYVDALCSDAELTYGQRPGGPLETVYFGGGTPSLLAPAHISHLLARFASLFSLCPAAEITLEAHPSTVDEQKLAGFRRAGISRISFGGESLVASELRSIGRKHTPEDVLEAARLARRTGFTSLALDLMYGLPGQSPASWRRTLDRALGAGFDHFSLYPLSIEPRTVFARLNVSGRLAVPDDDAVVEMYHLTCDVLREAGYRHYEVSNWALPGHESRHNAAYWLNREFYAIGVGAHGYLKPYRTERVRQTKRYIDLLSAGLDPIAHRELVDGEIERAETIMLGMRLLDEGLDLAAVARKGADLRLTRADEIDRLVRHGLVCLSGDRLRLEESAVPVANEIWQSLM